jgi:thymidylate synthase (FAD)
MILVKPTFAMLDRYGLGMLQKIELAGRTCYKSEDKITPDSAGKFVQMIINRGHESVLEHSSIILWVSLFRFFWWRLFYDCKFFHFTLGFDFKSFRFRPLISGNIRAFRDLKRNHPWSRWITRLINRLFCAYPECFFDLCDETKAPLMWIRVLGEDDLITDEEELTHIHRAVKVMCDRGVSHEIVRQRAMSFSQESTRYCNYTKGHVTFVIPPWVNIEPGVYGEMEIDATPINLDTIWLNSVWDAETVYQLLTNAGWKPEQARSVLSNSLKTEIVISGTLKQWHYFLRVRAAGEKGKPHPQMLETAVPILEHGFKMEFPDHFGMIESLEVPQCGQ